MRRIFTYEEALEMLPEVQRRTTLAVEMLEALAGDGDEADDLPAQSVEEYQRIVADWAQSILDLGIEVKGLWLIDFDSGSGYYCWKHPEPTLQYFHGYDEGFTGRVKLN
jgi:hypothetical protein